MPHLCICRTKLEEQGEREKIRAAVRNMGDVVYKPLGPAMAPSRFCVSTELFL